MHSHSIKTVLVTGGAGFIGSCLVRWLVANGQHRVINFDKLTYAGNLDSLAAVTNDPRHVFVRGDLCHRPALEKVLRDYSPSAVMHLAAESHVDRSIDGPLEFVRTNVLGTCELLEAVRGYWQELPPSDREQFRFVHVSTDEVYGSLGQSGLFSESSPYAPNSPYSASKAAADHFVRAYHHTYGLPTITTHCSNNYGPFQYPDKLIPLMILNAFEGRPLPIYGDGLNVRDWLFVEDHAAGLCQVLNTGLPGEDYNLGGGCERTNLQVVHGLCTLVDQLSPDLPHVPCKQLIQFVPDRPGHDRRYAMDTSKVTRELGWQPQQNFESGLEITVRWYLQNGDWIQRVLRGNDQSMRHGLIGKRTSS